MFSSLCLAGASAFILNGYLNFRKEGQLVKIFDELIKIETYDVDFVSSLEELPKDKDIIISGDDWGFVNLYRNPALKGAKALSYRAHSSHVVRVLFD